MSAAGSPLSVALVGFGTVGRAVARLLTDGAFPSLRLRAVCTRRVDAARQDAPWVSPDVTWLGHVDEVPGVDAQVIVEVAGGIEPARSLIARALAAGRSVVTANKQVMAEHGPELISIARAHGQALRFEAAVASVTPVLRGVQDGLGADVLSHIAGVVNGTTNYVLTRMERDGVSLDAAVADAQARGYAEADPSADIDGLDARAKLVILAAVGLGQYVRPSAVPTESIRGIEARDLAHAASIGMAIRQVAWAERAAGPGARPVVRVAPVLVDRTAWLARAEGPRNVIVVVGARSGETVFVGEGAGAGATAVAVVSDLLAVADARTPPRAWPVAAARPGRRDAPRTPDVVAPHYVRVSAPNGAASPDPADALERAGLRIRSVLNGRTAASGARHWAGVLDRCSQRRLSEVLAVLVAQGGAGHAAIRLPIVDVGSRQAPGDPATGPAAVRAQQPGRGGAVPVTSTSHASVTLD